MDWAEYEVIPYLRRPEDAADNRAVPIFPLWEGERWRLWLPTPAGLLEVNPVDLAEGGYVAKAMRSESDLFVPFLDTMWKRASWPDLSRWLTAIEMDTFRLAASLAKLDHFAECSQSVGRDSVMFVSTEIEYLLGRSRSLFDDLQLAINALWARIELRDPSAHRIKKQQSPPKSFSDVATKVRRRADGEAPYAMPPALLACYDSVAEFFFAMKDVRDRIVHRAAGVGSIFMLPGGFGVAVDNPLTKLGPERKPEREYNEKVVALAPIVANVVCRSIYACNDFATAFAAIFKLPEPLIDGHHVFLRAPHAPSLANAQQILQGKTPWWSPSEQSTPTSG